MILLVAFGATAGMAKEGSTSHPIVIGFERFFTPDSTNLADGGELLLSELRCVNCHDPGNHAERIPILAGPHLKEISGRLNFDYLVEWLSNPRTTKPGTLMPHLLAADDSQAQQQEAQALAAYLVSIGGEFKSQGSAGAGDNGRELYHSVGCIACHAPDASFRPAERDGELVQTKAPSVPLGNLQQKYSLEGLAGFLVDPLKWHPDGRMPRIPLSESEAADIAAYLMKGSDVARPPASLPRELVMLGRKRFGDLGCAACHSVSETRDALPMVAAKPLSTLDAGSRGCLSNLPARGVPDYHLSPLQRRAILAALKRLPTVEPLTAAQQVHRKLLALNCYACHERDGIGGPEPGRAAFFQTTGADLEDEGRFPPGLKGVGRKLLPATLENVLRGGYPIRPYMTTRMPDFGEHHAAALSKAFVAADLTGDIKPTPRDGDATLVGRSPWGRDLIGTGGLGCINCHDLNGNKSLGIRAVDLMHAPKRLRPEWFRDYLIDPAAFKPGTRMPSFWPEGKAVHSLLGKNTTRQIDSLWVYLTELDQNRLPEGMEAKGNFELKPARAPIVFRTFMKEAGLHAIAVGYPEGVHLAFDAEQVRWSLAWRGRFLDAEGTWDDRFAPLAEPLGTNVMKWPTGTEVGSERGFKGYRLDARGMPTFLYRADTWEVEDTVEPIAGSRSLRRTVKLRGGKPVTWFGLLSQHHDHKIETHGTNAWSAGNTTVRLLHPAVERTTIMQNNGSRHLMVELQFNANDQTNIVTEVTW